MKYITLIITFFMFIACEEVIEIDLNSTDPQIIIEAKVSDLEGESIVYITESTDFYNSSELKKISGAIVNIEGSDGNGVIFDEISEGIYSSTIFVGNPNVEYTISVSHSGIDYKSVSIMPEKLELDSIYYKEQENIRFSEQSRYEFHCLFQDRANVEDYARFKIYVNDKQINNIYLYNDNLTDGNFIDYFRFPIQGVEIKKGDNITIELMAIDRYVYDYFNTLQGAISESSGGPFGSQSPGNPLSNWSNNAFGYFSAYTVSYKTIVIE
jgi:hypothetical protein